MQPAILPKDFENLRGLVSRVRELSISLDKALANSQLGLTSKPQLADGEAPDAVVLQYAKDVYAFRRKRSNLLPHDLFGEPAWDILLELFIMRAQGKSVRIKNACIASGVPATTALRWINLLERKGLISSSADAVDHRVRWIWLEDEAYQNLFRLLAEQVGIFELPPVQAASGESASVAAAGSGL